MIVNKERLTPTCSTSLKKENLLKWIYPLIEESEHGI